jgi:uncharacterized phage protein (TIGR01671 family)
MFLRIEIIIREMLLMRPIKFKAYDSFENVIFPVIEINFENKKITTLFRGFLHNHHNFDELTLLQFTGFEDKNKNEIYHFDLLKKGNSAFKVEFDKSTAGFIGVEITKSKIMHRNILDLIADGYLVEGNSLIV